MSLEEPVSTSTEKEEDKREERRRLLIAILFLLLSFSCIFCSSQTALWFVDRDSIRGSMLSSQSADYGFDPALALAPLSGDIAAEAEHDEALLQQVQTPIAQGLAIAVLPNPVPTLAPTPSPVPLITPTPTLTPSVVPATPVAGAPTSTSAPATPGPIPPTVVTAPPTVSSPTSPAPVVSPTAIPTNPATEIPTNTPTDPATDTPTDSPTDTTPNTPTHTPTNTPTPTPTNTPTSIPTGTPLPPSVSFSAPAYSAGEGSGSAIITVRLSAPSTQIVTVDYGTINGGTATAGSDYTPTNGTLTFAPGEIDKTFNVAIINDAVANEAIETVLLQLSNPTNATLGLSNATLAIVDNDAPLVQFSSGSYNAGEADGQATITVVLNTPSAQTITVDYGTINGGTATAGSDYTPTNGTLTFAPGETSKTFDVAILDDAVANEGNETVLLQLSNPSNATLGLSNATLTIVDDDALPLVQFSSGSYSAGEADGQATITVVLNTSSAQTITVDYGTINGGTATAGSDYTPTNGTLTFAPGETSKTFDVAILDDSIDEAIETVLLQLSNPSNAALGLSDATLEIGDDDPAPLVQFSSGSYSAGEADGQATITVVLDVSSAQTITVDYGTINGGTATAGSDYTPTNGTLTFAPGETSKTFDVAILDDAVANEATETVLLQLSNPTNATLGLSDATLEIVDDDPLPLVQFSSGSYSISEDAGLAPITVTLSSLSALTVTVDYTTSNGTAFAGADYLTTNGTLTFPPGTTDQLFDVPIIDDAGLETPDETLTITLSSPVDATLGSPNPATLTIIDDGDTGSCNTAIYTDFVEIGPPDCKWTVLTNTFVVIDLATQAGTAINVNGDGNSDYDLVVYERETTLAPSSIAMDRMTVELSIDGITWHTVLLWGDGTLDVNTNIGQAGYGPPNENDDTIIPMSDPPLYGPAGGIISGIAIDVDNPPSGPPLPAGAYRYVRITDTPGPAIQPTELDSIEILP